MTRYLAIRVSLALGVLWAAYTVAFVVLYLIPGDPVSAMAAGGMDSGTVSEERLWELREEYGFNDPFIVQYFNHLMAAATGDLGNSVQTGQPVTTAIGQVVGSTVQLASLALLISVVGGAGIALLATYTRAAWLQNFLLSLPPIAISLPTFWVGLLLIQLFSFRLGIFPAMGDDGFLALILPAVTLSLPIGSMIAQVLARSVQEAMLEPYVVTARAKGITRATVHFGHVLRNAALPALTVVGLVAGNLLAGSVVVETVFARPGIGQLTVTAVTLQDLPVVLGVVTLGAVVFVTANLLVDLVLPLVDPRVSIGHSYA
ncbi:MAG TPA: ABC transporter permease [Enteractinococcus helveticum]|uniref:ABC transporter permease n=1 Tax=Enteractinococcus helveticum TaxID=1837282 RepID=A0A921K845_9MICC|nr:ABC transporter permease [Enteractinococcus helveticum]HJF15382.1 ABC transporter permease [Enteractinococcus helveticum]